MLISSLGFHTLTLSLSLKASEPTELLSDFFHYNRNNKNIIIEKTCREYEKIELEPIEVNDDDTFPLPLITTIHYRQDIGIRWRIVSNRSNPN